jgi:hypothetical protein
MVPSMHNVITGFYQPNEVDIEAGITRASFGTAINVLTGQASANGCNSNQNAIENP